MTQETRLCDNCIRPIGNAHVTEESGESEPYRFCCFACKDDWNSPPKRKALIEKRISEHCDAVNHPSHYNSGKFEVAEVIEDWNLDFRLGNAVKYIARAGKKDPAKYVEDLKKAIWYVNRAIYLRELADGKTDVVKPNDMVKR